MTVLLTSTAPENALTGIAGWAVDLMETLGGLGAGIAIAAENLFPPLPSEVILPLAGFTASQGSLGLLEVIVWTTLGSIVGALALYGIGAMLGRSRMRWLAERIPLIRVEDVDKAEAWFDRHGAMTVFFGRMIPIFRSLISIPAGVQRMNLALFIALTTAGSLIWNTIFVLAGFLLGENWHLVEAYADVLQYVVIGAVVIVIGLFLVVRIRSIRAEKKRAPEPVDSTADRG
jgi:membrane protein DedA with SNARE-associated domain